MTKIRIAYSREPRESHQLGVEQPATAHFTTGKTETFDDSLDLRCITFDVVDSKYANTFLEQWINDPRPKEDVRELQYNQYETVSATVLINCQNEMNSIVDDINEHIPEFPVDTNLKLKVTDTDIQDHKLNALHEYFEDTSNAYLKSTTLDETRRKQLYYNLDKINSLVHKMERFQPGRNMPYRCHNVIRSTGHFILTENCYNLVDDDYADFEVIRPGALYIDFATVGKDFFNCVWTNDTELVKNGKVSPQEYIRPSMCFTVIDENRSEQFYIDKKQAELERAQVWLEENQLTQYTDAYLPKNTVGRLKLGTPENGSLTHEEFLDIHNSHPYMYGVYVED